MRVLLDTHCWLWLCASPERFSKKALARLAVTQTDVLEISAGHALRVGELPYHHRDPFDRMLIAQALVEGIPLMTADRLLARYDVERLRPA